MKNNLHKKYTYEDKFARHFYAGSHTKAKRLAWEKKRAVKDYRRKAKTLCKMPIDISA